jgi:hypothetical protein
MPTLKMHCLTRKLREEKKTLLRGFSIPNPNFSEFAFLVDIFEKVRIVDFNPSSNLL